jgi:hypothetical protein
MQRIASETIHTVGTTIDDVHFSRQSSHHLAQHSIHTQLQHLHEKCNQQCQSPLEVLLDKPVRVLRKPRSASQAGERICSTNGPAQIAQIGADRPAAWNTMLQGLEAPRKHMGRKTRAKARRNQRYAMALQALELTQSAHCSSSENDDAAANTWPCSLPNQTGTEQSTSHNACKVSVSGHSSGSEALYDHAWQSKGTGSAKQLPQKSPCACQAAVSLVRSPHQSSTQHQSSALINKPFVGIVGSVLANLRGL